MPTNSYKTVSRTKILDYLKENCDRSYNVQEINQFLLDCGVGVNITTIYRYLNKLTEEGQVMKYASEDGSQCVFQYIKPTSHCDEHLHLKCVKCGMVCHVEKTAMNKISSTLEKQLEFTIQCKNSIIYGTCANCAK